jgi:hypothetical protein
MAHLTGTEAAPAAVPPDCSGWTSFGGAAQAEKIASVEREIIETQLNIRALFKFLLLLVDLQICGEKRNAISTSRFLHRPEKSHNCSSESLWVRIASSVQSRLKTFVIFANQHHRETILFDVGGDSFVRNAFVSHQRILYC